jgi:hypothetical protein
MTPSPPARGDRWLRVPALVCAVLLVAGSIACAPAVTEASLSTPYQVALGAYYALLADEIDAASARGVIGEALAADVADDAIRMVLAQVELHDVVLSGSPAARARLIGQLVAVDASLRSGASAVDWVEARLFVTLGDLLTVDAQRDYDRWLEQTGSVEHLWAALLRFDAADAAYRFARRPGDTAPSPGLLRERDHAATARVSSQLAVVATIQAIAGITTSPEGALRRLREEAMAFLASSLEADVGAEEPAIPPVRGAVGLDGSVHVLRSVAFGALADEAMDESALACLASAGPDAAAAALQRYVDRLWMAARHAVIAETLGVEYDAGELFDVLEQAATWDPERACALLTLG